MGITEKHIQNLYETILKLNSIDDCKDFFNDLCTYKEIEQMAQRIIAAKLMLDGKTYEEITRETDISSATLSRISKCIKYGNGYKNILSDNND